jgi:cellobiose phosphorylase
MGLRTRISDDKLFLCYAAAEYITVTGDESILKERVSYLQSPPLHEGELCRYENAEKTSETDVLHAHCMAAFRSSLKTGEHGLLLLGTGDWNDGLDYIGERGLGESVALTMFAYQTLKKYLPYCSQEESRELSAAASRLKEAVQAAYDGKQFFRLYGDDGRWYGGSADDALQIDLLSQSFAVLSGVTDEERGASAVKEAESLIDKENGIIRLLAPALDHNTYLGYISAYPKGVRENGGQYTHAAIWYLQALLRLGEREKAYEYFTMINPLAKCRDRKMNQKYKGEPYVMPADIYAHQNAGRMGWSWYTGSAAWTYRLILEDFLGVKKRGENLYIEPNLPKSLSRTKVQYKTENGALQIEYIHKGRYRLLVGGEETNGRCVPLRAGLPEITVEY